MNVYRQRTKINSEGIAMAIGNFDAMHKGHQDMLLRLVSLAKNLSLTPAVMSFDPSPQAYFAKKANKTPPFRLSTTRQKIEAMSALGIETLYLLPFAQGIAELSAADFLLSLKNDLGVSTLVLGEDFHFGKNRQGNIDFIVQQHAQTGINCHPHQNVLDASGQRYSSSRVRHALLTGQFDEVRSLLGCDYVVRGRVVHGQKLGRTLGYPTINIWPPNPTPLSGVYTVKVMLNGGIYGGVASIGTRPTVNQLTRKLLEVTLFNFSEECYGALADVHFLNKLRDEEKFADLDSLVAQMRNDEQLAREFLEPIK